MTAPVYDVLILGAGFTGTALAIQLARGMPAGGRVLLLGTPKATGRGLAYGTDNPDHLLNVRAERMSLFPDDPDHFVHWLEARQPGKPPQRGAADSYAPRHLYGRYLRDCLHQAIAEARSRVRVEVLEGTVVDLQKSDRGYLIRTASGQRFHARAAALCLGNGQPDFPFDMSAITGAVRDHLIADPWSDYRMRTILPDQRVLLLGTGLTMIDQALTLERAGHTAALSAISRHGLLPAAHLPTRTEPCSIAIPRGKVSLMQMFRLVVEAARDEVAAGRDWRSVVDGLRPHTQELWARFGVDDQRRLFRHLAALWSAHRHRMAGEAAERLARLCEAGRLTVEAARIVAIRHAPRGVTVALRRRGERTVELVAFDWVVNCSGTGRALSGGAEPILRQAIALGLARPDACNRGLDVEADGGLIGRTGASSAGLYALGPLTAGRFFEITAVPEIRVQCATVADALVDYVAAEKRTVALPRRGRTLSGSVH